MKLSATQIDVLRRMGAGSGAIARLPGGFWATPETPLREAGGVPEWSVTIPTIRALERLHLLARAREFPEEWRDTRRLTPDGRIEAGSLGG
jgi:hypothetical protein